jgi:leucyl aminopeptidase
MKSSLLYATVVFIATSTTSTALSLAYPDQAVLRDRPTGSERYLIELGPGETRWVTEDEKWALRRVIYGVSHVERFGVPSLITQPSVVDLLLKLLVGGH